MEFESVYFELTNICNLNCKTCYNRSGLNKERKEIPVESLFTAIEMFRRYGLQSVHLSGGETMLYSDIQSLFEKIAATPNIYFTMTTNGTVNGELLLAQYRKNKNFFVQISLDGSCEEVNAKTRGQGGFAKALAVLKGLHDSERPVGYRIKMVLSKYNFEDILSYFRLASEYGCEPQFSFMSLIGNGLQNQEDMLLSDMDKMKALRYIDEGNKAYGMQVKLPFCAFSCPFGDVSEDLKINGMVKPNGDIMPCQGLYDENYRLGNIYAFDEREVFDNIERLKNIVCTRLKTDYGCSKCLIEPLCKRGCPSMALLNSGDIMGTDKECAFRLKHYLKYQFRK